LRQLNSMIIMSLLIANVFIQAQGPDKTSEDRKQIAALRQKIAVLSGAELIPALNDLSVLLIEVDVEQADSENRKAIELLKGSSDRDMMGYVWLIKAQILYKKGHYEKALTLLEQARKNFVKTANKDGLFLCFYHVGRTALAKNDNALAIDSLQNALRMENMFRYHPDEVLFSYIKLSILYCRQKDWHMAQRIVDEGIRLATGTGSLKHLGYLFNQAGLVAGAMKNPQKEIQMYKIAREHFEKINFTNEILSIEHNIGTIYKELGQFNLAEKHLKEAYVGFIQNNSQTDCLKSLIHLGQLYSLMGKKQEADLMFQQALSLIDGQSTFDQLWVIKAYADHCFETGQYQESSRYYRRSAALNEILYNQRKEEQIALLRESFDADRREHRIGILERDQKIARITRNFLIVLLLLIIFVMWVLMRKYRHLFMFWKKQKFIGQYCISGVIASGGMGTVYQAYPIKEKKRTVAIKVLKEGVDERPDFIKRFKREGEIIDRLDHPNIVKILERGSHNERPYIVMEYLSGKTLEQYLQENKLSVLEKLLIMLQISQAIEQMHKQKIMHCDIKGQNIMVCKNPMSTSVIVKILDFGLAKMGHHSRLTTVGMIMGTLNHTAPELFYEPSPTLQADIYSLGVVFYSILTGNLPFENDSEAILLKQILHQEPKAPGSFSSGISSQINILILQMLDKHPSSRPDAEQVISALKNEIKITLAKEDQRLRNDC